MQNYIFKTIFFTKLNDKATTPTKGTDGAVGFDLYACVDNVKAVFIEPHETKLIGTGIAMDLPRGFFGGIFARSGLATKQGLRPANCVGVIDPDYRGEIKVALHNDTDSPKSIKPNDRIAQLIIIPYLECDLQEVDKLSSTERGNGGFGSTGE